MELFVTETLGPVIADTWRTTSGTVFGPGVYVYLVDAPLSDTEAMQVQVAVNTNAPGSAPWAVIEDFTSVPTDLSSFSGLAGFQSAPVPLIDDRWLLLARAKHDSATDKTFTVRVIKL